MPVAALLLTMPVDARLPPVKNVRVPCDTPSMLNDTLVERNAELAAASTEPAAPKTADAKK